MAGKPSVADLLSRLTEFDAGRVNEFLLRLPDRYFDGLDISQIARDAEHLFNLKNANDHALEIAELPEDRISCTVYASDVPGLFSLLTGLLSATGFDIDSGKIFTYSREFEETVSTIGRGRRPRRVVHTREKPRYIIDRFSGGIREGESLSSWRDDFARLADKLFTHLSAGGPGAITEARRMVYEEVSRALIRRRIEPSRVLLPVEMSVSRQTNTGTNLNIISENTPFFLFSVSNALALYGFSIESVAIHTIGNRIEDIIEITDADGKALTGQAQINQVKMSVLLTKQFTYFLGSAPDPYSALLRFETISRELIKLPAGETFEPLLSNPDLLKDLSRLLSASDFLWEDFIRVQYENILPLLDTGPNRKPLSLDDEEVEKAIERTLDGAEGFEEKRKALNDFKNSEIYLIDLDHIVRPEADFLFLSRKLSKLAEAVVRAAVKIASSELEPRYGKPLTFAGQEARYAIMGLGKLGGAALGYASDIELLFIYADNGSTDGEKSVGNAEYFERLFKTAVSLIDTKREGIFQVDLRLRPYGKEGPLACSVKQFRRYYAPDGPAHPFERLALVRMRWIAGDPPLGSDVEQARDELLYQHPELDLDALWDTWAKQRQQKTRPGAFNAKYSPGALVDLESVVQLLQVRHARRVPQLRAPRLSVVLGSLRRAEILTPGQYADLVGAYHLLRKLINALRMLRGNAQDLFLPPTGSDELTHLARRMGYERRDQTGPAEQLLEEFHSRTAAIRAFVEHHFDRPCPGT